MVRRPGKYTQKPRNLRTTKKGKPRQKLHAKPKTPAMRDEILEYLRVEIAAPNNINVEIDFANPNGLDDDIQQAVTKYKIKRDVVGRPTKMTVPVLRKLKMAFTIGCTDEEACGFAGIGVSTLYDFQKEHPPFSELKNKWKATEVMGSRLNIFRSIMTNGSIEDSWRSLRAKRKDEFAEKTINAHENMVTTEELEQIAAGDIEEMQTMNFDEEETTEKKTTEDST